MGCFFSKEEALSFRKKKKMPKIPTHRHGLERIPTFQSVRPAKNQAMRKRPLPSEGDQKCNIFENIPQEYSTLAFLAGGKNFPPEDMIFQKVLSGPVTSDVPVTPSQEATPSQQVQVQEVRQVPVPAPAPVSAPTTFIPNCLSYKDSEKFCRSPGCVEHILDAIQRIKRWGWVMVVYKHPDNNAAYLPFYESYAGELFDSLYTRFRLRLRRIIVFKPSWYVHARLAEQDVYTFHSIFRRRTMKRMTFLQDQQELDEWTGFPEDYDDAKM